MGEESPIELAAAALAEQKYREALKYCKIALQEDQTNPQTLLLIGQSALGLEEYDQAELAFRRSLESQPNLFPAWEGLAKVYAFTGNFQGEVEANERLVSSLCCEHKLQSCVCIAIYVRG